ncbi:hypothetical protein C0J52_04244 [Blattella germanica]|nr:hypothetical protein C0J52_04244 [Blattella germanica]
MKRKRETESLVKNVEQTKALKSILKKSKTKIKKINILEGEAQETSNTVDNLQVTGENPSSELAGNKKKIKKIKNLEEAAEETLKQVKMTKLEKKKKKKKKSHKNKNNQISNKKDDDKDKCIDYLKKWQKDKNNWKFEKLKQIWLLKHMFDSENVPDSIFPILVEYISGSRGQARNMVEEKTMNVIKLMERRTELSEKGLSEEEIAAELPENVTEIAYERARLILQSLDVV